MIRGKMIMGTRLSLLSKMAFMAKIWQGNFVSEIPRPNFRHHQWSPNNYFALNYFA
jgi:hypothetical protein